MFGRLALALRGKLVVTALAAVLLIGGGSVAVAAATQGRILDLTPTVQQTHTQEPNGDNNNDQDEQCKATPSAGHECADNDDDDQGENCKATPSAGHECADNDDDDHGNGGNGEGTPTP